MTGDCLCALDGGSRRFPGVTRIFRRFEKALTTAC